MLAILNRPGKGSLWANIAVFVGATVVMNGLIFGLGWSDSTKGSPGPFWSPPDYVVGLVWSCLLFPLMATARWLLNGFSDKRVLLVRGGVTLLLISCILWPLYSLAIGSLIGGLIGNVWTVFLATVVVVRVWSISRVSALCVLPVVFWVVFATSIVLYELGWIH